MKLKPPEEYYASLPQKWMAGLTLYPCPGDTYLIVEPTYRDDWLLPGGAVNDNESPLAGAKRESIEEIGFEKVTDQLLVVSYIAATGIRTECVHFIFKGEELTEQDLQRIELSDAELKGYHCVGLPEAEKLVVHAVSQSLADAVKALQTGKTVYREGTTVV